jgi:hypothetical protein
MTQKVIAFGEIIQGIEAQVHKSESNANSTVDRVSEIRFGVHQVENHLCRMQQHIVRDLILLIYCKNVVRITILNTN